MLIYGIDVSDAQASDLPGTMPGVSFALIKATEGHTYTSPVQSEQAAAARRAGRPVGFYHFLWPGNIDEQANWFVTECASVPGDTLWVDWETTSAGTSATCAEKDAMLAAVKRLRPTHRVGLYCDRSMWLTVDTTSECGDGLWIADWDAPPGAPRIRHPWVLHQYGTVTGVDRDVYAGTAAALQAWAWAADCTPVIAYTVRAGDTMGAIAQTHGVTLTALENANPQVADPDMIFPGQVLRIP